MSDDSQQSAADDLSARVIDLEQKLTFQQAAFDQLNTVVLEQQAEIEKLRRDAASLREHLQQHIERGDSGDLPHEKPPHY